MILLSAAILLESLDLLEEAEAVKNVVNKSIDEGYVTVDIAGDDKSYKTSEVGDWLAANL